MRHTNRSGYSLVELLVVILIINILAAAAITFYVGLRDKARRAVLVRNASSAGPEIRLWIHASASSERTVRSVDTDFNGAVNGDDLTNAELFNNVAVTYGNGRNAMGDRSPIFPDLPLWNTMLPPLNGRITLIQVSGSELQLLALEKTGIILYQTSINVD